MLPQNVPALFTKPAAAGVGNDSFTVLLLHCDGTSGSGAFVDSCIGGTGPKTIVPGSCTMSSAQKKFGATSMLCNSPSGAHCAISSTAPSDFDFGNGNFTIDWWEYHTGGSAVNADIIARRSNAESFTAFMLYSASAAITLYCSFNGTTYGVNGAVVGTADLNTWTHFAVVRNGTNIVCYKNGAQSSTTAVATNSLIANNNNLTIGGNGSNAVHAYLDEIRISKGIARWTAPFTPPTAAYG